MHSCWSWHRSEIRDSLYCVIRIKKGDVRQEEVLHAVVGHIFIDDFSPVNSRLDPVFIELRNPHQVFLVVWRLFEWCRTTKLGTLPSKHPCTDTSRDICRPPKYLLRISTLGVLYLDTQWYLPLHHWISFGKSGDAISSLPWGVPILWKHIIASLSPRLPSSSSRAG